jgi:hypothetical protein
MQRLRIAIVLVLGIAACNLYWGDPSPDPHSGPQYPDASVHYPDAPHPPDANPWYPDGNPWYPDAYINDGGSCGGACPDAAYLPDACGGG